MGAIDYTTLALGGGGLLPFATCHSSQPHMIDQIHPIRITAVTSCRMPNQKLLQSHAQNPVMMVPTPACSTVDETDRSMFGLIPSVFGGLGREVVRLRKKKRDMTYMHACAERKQKRQQRGEEGRRALIGRTHAHNALRSFVAETNGESNKMYLDYLSLSVVDNYCAIYNFSG